MIVNERTNRNERVVAVAMDMLTAARTAPKGKGLDQVEAAVITGDDITALCSVMLDLYRSTNRPVYLRDSENIRQAEAVVVIGIRPVPLGLNCGHCGYNTCGQRPKQAPCAINSCDVGIALGSAVSVAADRRVDSRIMFSVGMAAERMNILPGCTQVYAIAVSASSKNPFFDRK